MTSKWHKPHLNASKGGDNSVKMQSQGKTKITLKEKGKVKTMSRERMVTRTIEALNVEIMGINTTNNVVSNVRYHFVGYNFKNDEQILKVAKAETTGTFIPVRIVSTYKTEKLYGMSEADFIKYAKELPPRTKAE